MPHKIRTQTLCVGDIKPLCKDEPYNIFGDLLAPDLPVVQVTASPQPDSTIPSTKQVIPFSLFDTPVFRPVGFEYSEANKTLIYTDIPRSFSIPSIAVTLEITSDDPAISYFNFSASITTKAGTYTFPYRPVNPYISLPNPYMPNNTAYGISTVIACSGFVLEPNDSPIITLTVTASKVDSYPPTPVEFDVITNEYLGVISNITYLLNVSVEQVYTLPSTLPEPSGKIQKIDDKKHIGLGAKKAHTKK